MTGLLDDDYLLTTDIAWELYRVAEVEPIVDVHNHLVPAQIAIETQVSILLPQPHFHQTLS